MLVPVQAIVLDSCGLGALVSSAPGEGALLIEIVVLWFPPFLAFIYLLSHCRQVDTLVKLMQNHITFRG